MATFSQSLDTKRFEILSGRKLNLDSKKSWDQKFNKSGYIFGKKPADSLTVNNQFLIKNSKVLDLGMGEGRNAVYLASIGHNVVGIDISSVAVEKAHALAKENGVKIKGIVANIKDYRFNESEFDAIICFYYVERTLLKEMMKWVKPGGLIFFEAYTKEDKKESQGKIQNKLYLLKPQEVLSMFPGWRVLKFEEPLHQARNYSSIIVQRPLK